MDFLQNINLGGNELKAFRVENATPSTISAYQGEGRLYYYNKLLAYYTKDDSNNTITLNLLTNKNGSIQNANLAHSSVTIAGGLVSLGGTLAATAMVTSGSTAAKISLIGTVSGESQFKFNSNLFIEGGVLHALGGLQLHQRAASDTGKDLEVVNIGTSANPVWALHTSLPFYSDSSVSSGGIGTGGGGGGGDVSSIKIDGVTQQNVDGVVTLNLAAYVKTTALSSYRTASEQDTIDDAIEASISTINGKIPAAATSSNQLADQAFVLTKIQSASANFRGNWSTWSAVPSTESSYPADYEGNKKPTTNDYLVVNDASGYGAAYTGCWRFKYSGDWDTLHKNGWNPEYRVNESPLTPDQQNALDSGITHAKVLAYDGYASRISSLESGSALEVITDTTVTGANVVTGVSKLGTRVTVTKGAVALLAGTTTSSIPEGTNKYYTDARVLEATNGVYEPLIAGDVDIKNSEFYFRPTADDVSISDGTAKLQVVKGNAVAVNQQARNGDFALGDSSWSAINSSLAVNNGIATITKDTGTTYGAIIANQRVSAKTSHKYYISAELRSDDGTTVNLGFYTSNYSTGGNTLVNTAATSFTMVAGIVSPVNNTDYFCVRVGGSTTPASTKGYAKNVVCIDLTQMFGSGNEPSELTDPRIKWLQSLGYIPYNAGSLVPLKMTGIETTGVNQWDEEWEPGSIDPSTGTPITHSSMSRSKNYLRVISGGQYYFLKQLSSIAQCYIYFYDANLNFLGKDSRVYLVQSRTFNIPSNAVFVRFTAENAVATSHIQVALYHSGGTIPTTYHPYEKHTLALDVTAITANGNRIFEDGMKAAETVYDELTGVVNGAFTKADKRAEKVNLGDLTWTYNQAGSGVGVPFFSATISDKSTMSANQICSKYTNVGVRTALVDKSIAVWNTSGSGSLIIIADSAYTTAAAFKAAMNGVYLYYELATPIEYTLDYPVPCEYFVKDWGTEALVPQGLDAQGVPATAPLKAEIAYGINVKDTIRLLPVEYQRISGRVNEIGENSDDNHYPTARAAYRNLAVRMYNVSIATSVAFIPSTYEFANDKLVATLYDANGNVVYADMQAVSNLDGKYTIRVEFASTSADTYKLVVIGKLA